MRSFRCMHLNTARPLHLLYPTTINQADFNLSTNQTNSSTNLNPNRPQPINQPTPTDPKTQVHL
jgi:hypothetical protein